MSRAALVRYQDLLSQAREAVQTNPDITTRQFQVLAGGSARRTGDALRAAKVEAGLALREEAAMLPAELRGLLNAPPAATTEVLSVEDQLGPVRVHLETALRNMESIVGQAREQYAEAVSITEARLGQQLADAQEHMAAIREQTSELEQELADTCTRAAEARELAAQRAHEQASRLAALDAVMTTERAERAALESENARLTTQVGSQLAELESNRVALTRLTAERDAKHRETEATEAHMEQVRAQSREARDEARAAHGDARQATATAAAAEERARALDAAHQRELAMLRDHTARLEATVAALRESKNNSQNGASKAEPRRRT